MSPSDNPWQTLTGMPRTAAGPVFEEPWQAQAFALVLGLHARGLFTWQAWTQSLAAELRAHPHDDGTQYYERWLAALEKLLSELGIVETTRLTARIQAFREAYERTPHGTPVLPP